MEGGEVDCVRGGGLAGGRLPTPLRDFVIWGADAAGSLTAGGADEMGEVVVSTWEIPVPPATEGHRELAGVHAQRSHRSGPHSHRAILSKAPSLESCRLRSPFV